MAKIKVGDIITGTALCKEYDTFAVDILSPRFVEFQWDRKKGERKKYKVLSALPSTMDYNEMKTAKYTTSASDLVAEAFSEMASLADELDEAYENMPENLQSTDLAESRQEAASACRDVDQPDLPDAASEIKVFHTPDLKTMLVGCSRGDRAAEASAKLRSVADAFRNHANELEETNDALAEELQSSADDLETSADTMDDISFPGMFG